MSARTNIPIRVSVWQAALECGVTVNKIKVGLKANGIAPGDDGKYSFKDIVTALSSRSGLELKAKEAKFRRAIDEADYARMKREELRGKLARLSVMKEYVLDYTVRVVQFIRHSSMTEREKEQLIAQIREMKFDHVVAAHRKQKDDYR